MQSVHITTKVVRSNHGHGWRGVLYTFLFNKVCQGLVVGWWFSPGSLGFSSTNTTNRPRQYNWNIFESGVKHHTPINMHAISVSCINKNITNLILLFRYVVSSVI